MAGDGTKDETVESPLDERQEGIRRLLQHGRRHLFDYISVADFAKQSEAMQHGRRRQEAQVDAKLKHICPDFEPPEEDADGMGTFINAGIMADSEALTNLLQQQNIKEKRKEEGPKKIPFWKKALATITGLTLAGIVGAVMSQYFSDDSDPVPYDIQAVPFSPEN